MHNEKPFRSVNVPTIIVKEIENLLKDDLCMYTTKADFITDAVRRHLENVKKDILDERRHKAHMKTLEP